MSEQDVYEHLARHMRTHYPDAIFHFDMAGVNNPSPRTRAVYSRLNRRGFPDLFIAEPRSGYLGLFLELKTDKKRPFKRNGELVADEHVREQAQYLQELSERGYMADFAVGLDNAFELITEYLGKPEGDSNAVF